jgi:hypothetical protein
MPARDGEVFLFGTAMGQRPFSFSNDMCLAHRARHDKIAQFSENASGAL